MKRLLFCFFLLISVSSVIAYAQKYESGYISVGTDSLYYESAGSGETILFIHDGVLPSVVWDEQFSYFSGNYRVVRYDRRGYGRSSAARGDYSNLEDLVEVFSVLGIDKACLVGASSGGALAIDMTLKYPEKVSSLVLVGAVVGGFSYTDHLKTRGGHMPSSFDDDLEQCLYLINDDPYLIYKENITAKEKALRILDDFPPHIINGQRIIRAAITPDRRLNEIMVPALILVGEYDLPDVHTCSGLFNAGIADSQRDIISGCGHLIPLERPDEFNEKVSGFLAEASAKNQGGGLYVPHSEDDFRSVEQTIRNNLGWAANKDFDLLRSTIQLDSSYLVVNPTNRVAIGIEDFRANEEFFASPDFEAVGFEITDLHINFSKGGDVAWFYCRLNDWNRWKGEPANWENARWTGVLEKINGNWRIRQQHFSYPAAQ